MSVETLILISSLGRTGLRLLPACLRKRRFWARLGLLAYAGALRRHFDATKPGHDQSEHRLAIDGAAAILERFAVPHPEKSDGPTVWRRFLASVVAAAEEGDIDKARAAIEGTDWDFDPARGRGEPGRVTLEGKEGRGRAIPTPRSSLWKWLWFQVAERLRGLVRRISPKGRRVMAILRAWWKMCAAAVILLAALTTVLVNLQTIKGWGTADSRPVETTGGAIGQGTGSRPRLDERAAASPRRPSG